jgi:hypothetical protein
VITAIGIAFVTLAFLAEKRGRGHRIVIGLRNSLSVLFALVLLIVVAFLLIRPFH